MGMLVNCAPIVRPAPFPGARDQVTDATLLGPFDGMVVDADTGDPIAGAKVVAIWAYDQGDGFVGPAGSEVYEVETDPAGRYRIPTAPSRIRGKTVRLVSFHLIVYERGYAGYRSEVTLDGRPRKDFYSRQNEVRLRKWRSTDSHAEHLLYLAAPRSITKLAEWERDPANLDLYRSQGGEVPGDLEEPGAEPSKPELKTRQVLDATALLSPEDVRLRTGYTEAFQVKDLGDLSREPFYHGVHFHAIGHDEPWDLAYRVWRDPPGGLDSVQETFEATLPGVKPTGEVTPQTWLYESKDILAVAFLEPDRDIGVLMTCGVSQCADIETVIILARALYENLDELEMVEAPQEAEASPAGQEGRQGPTPAPTRPEEEAPTNGEPESEGPSPEEGAASPKPASRPTRGALPEADAPNEAPSEPPLPETTPSKPEAQPPGASQPEPSKPKPDKPKPDKPKSSKPQTDSPDSPRQTPPKPKPSPEAPGESSDPNPPGDPSPSSSSPFHRGHRGTH